MSTNLSQQRRTLLPAQVSNPSPVFSLTTTLRTWLFVLSAFFCLAQMGWGNWQYTNGQTDTTPSGFGYYAIVVENNGTYTGTAELRSYTGSGSASVPPPVPISVTIDPGTAQATQISVNCEVKGFSNFILNSDLNFSGDLNIIGNFNLNGNDLAVSGDVIHQSGSLDFGTIPEGSSKTQILFSITGDYLQENDSDGNGTADTFCYGILSMTNPADFMFVGGNAQFYCFGHYPYGSNQVSAGTIELKGDLRQKNDSNYGHQSFQGSGTNRVLLSGTGTQTVTFDSPSSSHFNILEVTNPNPLVLASRIRTAQLLGNALTLQSSGTGGISGTLATDVTFTGNFQLAASLNLNGHTVTVSGGMDQKADLILGGGHLSVSGEFIHQSGSLNPGGGRLDIAGNYLQQRDADNNGTYESYCDGRLWMNHPADYVLVHGDAQFWGLWYQHQYLGASFASGTLEVKGDFLQKTAEGSLASSFVASNGHRVLLSGTGTQTVTFDSPSSSYFNILEVTNPTGVSLTTDARIVSLKTNAGAIVQVSGGSGILGGMDTNVEFSGNIRIIGDLNLNGHTLKVAGDVIHELGALYLNGGRLEITGDYLQQQDTDNDGTHETFCYGILYMTNPDEFMFVGGNAQFYCFGHYPYGSNRVSAGTIELKGDFRQKNDSNYGHSSFQGNGTHRVLLSGTGTQTVTFDSPSSSHFNILEVTNPNPLVLASRIRTAQLLGNALTLQSSGTGGISGTLATDVTFTGNFQLAASLNLNGHTVTVSGGMDQKADLILGGGHLSVSGEFIHQSGSLNPGGGRLDIAGNYLQQRDADNNGTYESYCDGRLWMNHPADYVLVHGDAQFWGLWYQHQYLGASFTSGTLEVKGDFMQKTAEGSLASSFVASNGHRVLLSGTSTQTVNFDSPGSSYFSVLDVTNPNHLGDTSLLPFSNGGTLNLDYAGTDVISALYIVGTQQANGVYDSANTGGLITGTGKIQVGPFVNYSAWTDVNAPGQTTDLDHDHDGVANGIEYFMGKTGNDFTVNPSVATDGTVTWQKSPVFNGSYTVQTSENLSVWTDVTEDAAQVTKNPDSVVWTKSASLGMRFVRIVVTPN